MEVLLNLYCTVIKITSTSLLPISCTCGDCSEFHNLPTKLWATRTIELINDDKGFDTWWLSTAGFIFVELRHYQENMWCHLFTN